MFEPLVDALESGRTRSRRRVPTRGAAASNLGMLYRPEAFDSLTDRPWDEAWMRGEIERIATDADSAYDPEALWPAEEWDSWQTPTPLKALYVGGAGVVWALGALERRGHAQSRLDLPQAARRVHDAWLAEPDYMRGIELPSPARAAFLSGEAGILSVAWQLAPDDALADALFERVTENAENEANEIMWGSPGTMLAAHAMHEWTGDERWAGCVAFERRRALAAARRGRSLDDPPLRRDDRALGQLTARRQRARVAPAAPGAERAAGTGTAAALAAGRRRGRSLTGQPAEQVTAVVFRSSRDRHLGRRVPRRGAAAGRRRAGLAGGGARRREGLRDLPRHRGQRLRAPEDVRAHRRRALARARPSLRNPALEQAERLEATRGRRRYSLWTGDVGAALYAGDCLDAKARYPVLDAGNVSAALQFRPMVAGDLRQLHEWLQRPHVRRWCGDGGRTMGSSSTTFLRSRVPTPPTTTSFSSMTRRLGCSRRTSSRTTRTMRRTMGTSDLERRPGSTFIGEAELVGTRARHSDPPALRRRHRARAAGDDGLHRRSGRSRTLRRSGPSRRPASA